MYWQTLFESLQKRLEVFCVEREMMMKVFEIESRDAIFFPVRSLFLYDGQGISFDLMEWRA